jgi:hypothetical protein
MRKAPPRRPAACSSWTWAVRPAKGSSRAAAKTAQSHRRATHHSTRNALNPRFPLTMAELTPLSVASNLGALLSQGAPLTQRAAETPKSASPSAARTAVVAREDESITHGFADHELTVLAGKWPLIDSDNFGCPARVQATPCVFSVVSGSGTSSRDPRDSRAVGLPRCTRPRAASSTPVY